MNFAEQRRLAEYLDLEHRTQTELEAFKQIAIACGYRVEVSADGKQEKLIRPDGSVAVVATKKAAN
jgi:hypothetical protein